MKGKAACVGVVITVLMIARVAQGGISIVKNGSFENDGKQIANIMTEAPLDWPDIDISTNFGGKMNTAWWTHSYDDGDGNSLTLYSKPSCTFTAGQEAMISQQVCLKDVNEIIFDIEVSGTHSAHPWESTYFSAILRIDGNDIWDSNDPLPDGNAEYLNVTADVNDKYAGDANLYSLSLVLRANKSEYQSTQYLVRWDFVKFDAYCGGFGYLPEDINRDCFVDFYDFAMLAGHWLGQRPSWEYDLAGDRLIDESDLMVFAAGWLDNSYWENWQDDNCFEVQLPVSDLNKDGIINFYDFAILAEDTAGLDYNELSKMAGEWLERNWLYGL